MDAAYRSYLEKALGAEDRFRLQPRQHGIPRRNAFSGGKWVVTASRIVELKPGDVIESIDSQSFEQFFPDRRRFIAASTEQ